MVITRILRRHWAHIKDIHSPLVGWYLTLMVYKTLFPWQFRDANNFDFGLSIRPKSFSGGIKSNKWHPCSEILSPRLNDTAYRWREVGIYPFHLTIFRYAITSIDDAVYIFGGQTYDEIGVGEIINQISKFNRLQRWVNAGTLQQKRYSAGAIALDDQTLIIGGHGSKTWVIFRVYDTKKYFLFRTELWNSTSGDDTIQINPVLLDFYEPILFPVSVGFCGTYPQWRASNTVI